MHLNLDVVILTEFLSLAASNVVQMSTSGADDDKNFSKK